MAHSPRARRMHRVHKAPAKLDEVRNEINVTPLVDICLVLLIIFMVIGPMLARGKEVVLPETSNHKEPNDTRQPIIAIDKKGQIYVDKTAVRNFEEMKERLKDEQRALIAENNELASGKNADNVRLGENRVLLKAHVDLTFKDVRPVIMAIHEMEISNIDLGTTELKEE